MQVIYYLGIENGVQSTQANPLYWEGRYSTPRNTSHHHTLIGSSVFERINKVLNGAAMKANLPREQQDVMYHLDTTHILLGEDGCILFKGTNRGANFMMFK